MKVIRGRRSVRRFRSVRPGRELVLKVLEAAVWAPSAHNSQPWRFILVDEFEVRRRLADRMAGAWLRDMRRDGVPEVEALGRVKSETYERILEAPLLILVCLDTTKLHTYPDERRQAAERTLGVQSVAAAVQNMLLAAYTLGLGSCWLCAPLFCKDEVREVLEIPEYVEPQAMVVAGYPAEEPEPPQRSPLRSVVFLNSWGAGL